VIFLPQIRPITDLRNTNEISEICHQSHEPVFITKNGYGDLVVMSMETYERQIAIIDVYKKLLEAEAEITNGAPLIDGEEVFRKLRTKHGKQGV
jgi:PHD/YefM family antitoxin component YafN of YafNO toxin-antitoxin module